MVSQKYDALRRTRNIYARNTLLTRKILKSIFLTTDLLVEGNLKGDFYAEQRALEENKTIWVYQMGMLGILYKETVLMTKDLKYT